MTAITPTDRPKSIRNRCVPFVMLSRCSSDFFSVGVGAFVRRMSHISSFLCCPLLKRQGPDPHIFHLIVTQDSFSPWI